MALCTTIETTISATCINAIETTIRTTNPMSVSCPEQSTKQPTIYAAFQATI